MSPTVFCFAFFLLCCAETGFSNQISDPITFHEDLSQYFMRPIDLVASKAGLMETVCHGEFCCDFTFKTSFNDSNLDESYSMVVYDGVKNNSSDSIRVQICGILACAGVYKRKCDFEFTNETSNVIFEEIKIEGNFSKNSIQYPTAYSPSKQPLPINQFKLERTDSSVKMTLEGRRKLVSFGIYGRDFGNNNSNEELNFENVFSLEMQEYFDYLWIRLRVMVFIVSIYVLEMI